MPFDLSELRKFTTAGHAIAAAAKISFEEWARLEMGVILKMCAGKTKVATLDKIDKRSRLALTRGLSLSSPKNNEAGISINAGARMRKFPAGIVWQRTAPSRRNGGKAKYKLAGRVNDSGNFISNWLHFSASEWAQITNAVEAFAADIVESLAAGRKTQGLGRQAWVQAARALGIDLANVHGGGTLSADGIAKAEAALASNGKLYLNGGGEEIKTQTEYVIGIFNRYPKNQQIGADRILEEVLTERLSKMRRTVNDTVLASPSKLAREFPYLEIAA